MDLGALNKAALLTIVWKALIAEGLLFDFLKKRHNLFVKDKVSGFSSIWKGFKVVWREVELHYGWIVGN